MSHHFDRGAAKLSRCRHRPSDHGKYEFNDKCIISDLGRADDSIHKRVCMRFTDNKKKYTD